MGKKAKQSLGFDGELPLEQVVDIIQELSERISNNHFSMNSAERSLNMQSGPIMSVSLKAKADPKESSIKLQLRWEPGELGQGSPVKFGEAKEEPEPQAEGDDGPDEPDPAAEAEGTESAAAASKSRSVKKASKRSRRK